MINNRDSINDRLSGQNKITQDQLSITITILLQKIF